MKVLFAVSSDSISDAIIKKYQKDYKEILSYKNVYYFNAILKEIQKDKSYDRIVISEDLEPFSNTNYDAIDKFIFEKLDNISDEAQDIDGNETSIILICTDRHTTGSSFLVKLFSIGIYNALLGSDRKMENVCKLINKPRVKKEAKMYYKIDSEDATYSNKSEKEVSELEIQNILTHFKKLGKNTDKFADSFNNIASQYTDDQLKIIINCLPINVKAVLEEDCQKYQELMSADGMIHRINKETLKTKDAQKQTGIKIDIIENKLNQTKMTGPIVIPSSVRTSKTKSPAPVRPVGKNIEIPVSEKKETAKVKKVVKRVEPEKEIPSTRPAKSAENIAKLEAKRENSAVKKDGVAVKKTKPTSINDVISNVDVSDEKKVVKVVNGKKVVKKVPVKAVKENVEKKQEVQSEKTNKLPFNPDPNAVVKRGRPKKVVKQELPKDEDLDEDIMLPGMDDEEDTTTTLPGLGEDFEDDVLSNFDDFEDDEVLPGLDDESEEVDEEDDMLPGMDDEVEEVDEEDDMLPGMDDEAEEVDDEDDMLPGMDDESEEVDEEDDMLPGMDDEAEEVDEEDDMLPGMDDEVEEVDDEDDMLPGMDDEFEEVDEEDDMLPGMDDEAEEVDDEDDMLPGMDDEVEEVDEEDDMLPGMDDEFEEVDEEDNMLPGTDDEFEDAAEEDEYSEEVDLPGLDDLDDLDDDILPNSDDEFEDTDDVLPGIEGFEDADDGLIGNYDDYDEPVANNTSTQEQSTEIESIKPRVDYSMSSLNSLLTKDKKIVTFIGTTKNGTSFLINNLAALFSSVGINTAILDMTKNRNSYYIYTNNEEELRNIAYNSISKLQKGFAEGIKVNKNLSVYTALPNDGKDYSDAEPILSTLVQNHSLILIDCDFDTDPAYFASCQEIYLVQSMDILTIQPLTAFLRDLKSKGVLESEKVRVVINKEIKVRSLTTKAIIGGMSFYNDPSMSFMTELFNKDMVKACSIPFEDNAYSKYLDAMVNCNVSLNGYSKQFLNKLRNLGDMVYPLVSKPTYGKTNTQVDYGKKAFSSSMSNTLNQMKNKF